MFIRALVVALTILVVWWPLRSFGIGLGLGNANVESTLSSPLRISIPLRGMDGVVLDPEKFSIEIEDASRPNLMHRLEDVVGDNATIVLYTRQMVTDPVVHFRLKVKWQRSAIARSYDVFIDPPQYRSNAAGDEPAPVAADPALPESQLDSPLALAQQNRLAVPGPIAVAPTATLREGGSKPVPEPASDSAPDAQLQADFELEAADDEAPVSEPATRVPEQRREYGPTINGNSIWRVARAVSTDNEELTIYQCMYGIWKANPHGFTRSNMHRLNMGVVLSIPLEREIAEFPHSKAWRAYSSQMAMLQTSTEPEKAIHEVVEHAGAGAELISEEVEEADPQASSPANSIRESVIARTDGLAGEAMNRAAIANIEAADASIDIGEVEAAMVVASFDEAGVAASESPGVVLDLPKNPEVSTDSRAPLQRPDASEDSLSHVAALESASPAVTATSRKSRGDSPASLLANATDSRSGFAGGAWQRFEQFITDSSSWLAMIIGSLITLLLMVLIQRQGFRSGRAPAEVKFSSVPGPLVTPASSQDVVLDAEAETPPRGEPGDMAEVGSDGEQQDSSADAGSQEPPPSEMDQPLVKRGLDRRASDRREASAPKRPPNRHYNSDEILDKANSFLEAGDVSEAVKLLELTVKLQPDRLHLVLRLLEIYYELKNAEAFEVLVHRFKPALEVMELSKQIDLQVMYTALCPDSAPLIDPQKASDPDDTDPRLFDSYHDSSEIDVELDELAVNHGADSGQAAGEEYPSTQVILFKDGEVLQQNSPTESTTVGEALYPEVTLQEVDVYLAYGLYDSAEELLKKGMEACPGRVDFMARLLDSYYATGNVVDFETEAEALKSLGEAADPYWEKVVIMGYELAPYNEMFSQGKGKSLGAFESVAARPEQPDFDLGAIYATREISSIELDHSSDVDVIAENETVLADDGINQDFGDAETGQEDLVELAESGIVPGEAEIAPVDDSASHEPADTSLDVNEVDLELDEFALYEDADDLEPGEAEFAIDDNDEQLVDLDLAAAFSETNLNLDAVIVASKDPAFKPGSLDTALILQDDKVGEAEVNEVATDDLPEAALQDDDDEIVLLKDEDDEELMEFTMPEKSEAEATNSNPHVDNAAQQALEKGTDDEDEGLAALDSRILYFPDGTSDKVKSEQFEEFASEVRMTLQAIRDQLQNITERQYLQERETRDLRKSVVELNGDGPELGRNDKKNLG